MKPRATIPSHPIRHHLARATTALLIAAAFAATPHAKAGTYISVNIAPPPLPVYEQPFAPGPGYLWTPGYWAWDPGIGDYYWVPGTWVRPPSVGVYWTPGYWGWSNRVYVFHSGYWGPHVGYYGGINYGFGYGGVGYAGGYWRGGGFWYNTSVNRFAPGVRITNVYNRTVINNITINRVSYNGPGGANHRATREELVAERERHVEASAEQIRHREAAQHDQSLRASVNHGAPKVAATDKPGDFSHANPARNAAMATHDAGKAAAGGKSGGEKAMAGATANAGAQGNVHAGGKSAHTAARGTGGASAKDKIILQHHPRTDAQAPGGGGKRSTESRIILQHHHNDAAPGGDRPLRQERPHPVERMRMQQAPRLAPPHERSPGGKPKDHHG